MTKVLSQTSRRRRRGLTVVVLAVAHEVGGDTGGFLSLELSLTHDHLVSRVGELPEE